MGAQSHICSSFKSECAAEIYSRNPEAEFCIDLHKAALELKIYCVPTTETDTLQFSQHAGEYISFFFYVSLDILYRDTKCLHFFKTFCLCLVIYNIYQFRDSTIPLVYYLCIIYRIY